MIIISFGKIKIYFLLFLSDIYWHNQRKFLLPTLNRNAINKLIPTFNKHARNSIKKFKSKIDQPDFDIKHMIGATIAAQSVENLFNIPANDEKAEHVYHECDRIFYVGGVNVLIYYMSRLLWEMGFLAKWLRNIKCPHLEEMAAFAMKNYELENNSNNNNNNNEGEWNNMLYANRVLEMKENPDIKNVNCLDHLVFIIAAAVDTSTVTASNIILLLAMNPEIQEKCYEEIKSIWTDTDQDIDVNLANQMTFLTMTIKECMRILPTAPIVERTTNQDIHLGEYHLI